MELFKNLEDSNLLFLSDPQNYIPIYKKFFTLSENKLELFDIIENINPDIIHIDEMSERLDIDIVKQLYSNNRTYRIIETCHDVSFNPNDKRRNYSNGNKAVTLTNDKVNTFKKMLGKVNKDVICFFIYILQNVYKTDTKISLYDIILLNNEDSLAKELAKELAKKLANKEILLNFLGLKCKQPTNENATKIKEQIESGSGDFDYNILPDFIKLYKKNQDNISTLFNTQIRKELETNLKDLEDLKDLVNPMFLIFISISSFSFFLIH